MQKKENRGVRKTKNQIKDSLLHLLEKKYIDKISVKELCEIADINRGTFYFHYHDIYDLLEEIENDFSTTLKDIISRDYEDPLSGILAVLDFLDENILFTLRVIENRTKDNFISNIQLLFENFIANTWENEINIHLHSTCHLAERFIFGGIIYNFYFCHKNKMEIDPEKRRYFIENLLYNGIINHQ